MGCVSILLTALKNYLSISLTMEKKPKEVEQLLVAESGHRRPKLTLSKPLRLTPHSSGEAWYDGGVGRSFAARR